jgi:hypothetical protein
MHCKTSHWDKGSSLVVVILALGLLTALALVLILNTASERAISRNSSATSKALFSADTGIQKLRTFLSYDYANDRIGLALTRAWSNKWLIVPSGTTGACTTNAGGVGLAPCAGDTVGLPSVTYFNLDPTGTADTDNDGIIDIDTPWYINTTVPGATGDIRNNRWRIMFRNFRETPNATVSNSRIFLMVVGVSETYGTGKSGIQLASASSNINAGRFVENGLAGEVVSVWNNIVFLGGPVNTPFLGTIKLYGSAHVVNGTDGSNTIDMSGNLGFFNYYHDLANGTTANPPCCNNGPDTLITDRLAPMPVGPEGPTLNSKVRIRVGDLSVTSSATIGCDKDTTTNGKETFDALFMNGTWANAANLHFDAYGDYDVSDDFLDQLKFPDSIDNTQTYADSGITYPNYQAYLVGNSDGNSATPDYGGAALDLTPINPTNSNNQNDRWEFEEESTTNKQEANELLTNLQSGSGLETRGTSGNNSLYINNRSMNWLTRNIDAPGNNPQGNPLLGGSTGTIVYFGFDRIDGSTPLEPVIGYQTSATGSTLTWVRGGVGGSTGSLCGAGGALPAGNPPPPCSISNSTTPAAYTSQRANLSGAYFVVKMVRYTAGGQTHMYVHSLVYLPKERLMSKPFVNFLFDNVAQTPNGSNAWGTMFPNATIANGHQGMIYLINDYLQVPNQDDGDASTPDPDGSVDISQESWTGCSSVPANGYNGGALGSASMTCPLSGIALRGDSSHNDSALISSGAVLLPGPLYISSLTGGPAPDRGITYDGRFTWYLPSWAPSAPALTDPAASAGNSIVHVDTYLFPRHQFPCDDAMVIMSAGDVDTDGSSQSRDALLIYARNKVTIRKQYDFAGTIVAWSFAVGNGSGNPNYMQVPALLGCLPDFLIAKDNYTYLRTVSWVER